MAKDYHCTICGKRMEPMVIWTCIKDNEAFARGETVSMDHHHTPDTKPGDAVAFVLHGPVPAAQPRLVLYDADVEEES